MIKKWKKFNEDLFSKKTGDEIKPMGVKTTVPRAEQPINKLSDEELEKIKKDFDKTNIERNKRIDSYFMQEITDRILGPDSEAYISEITELNKKYRSRKGKTGIDVFKD